MVLTHNKKNSYCGYLGNRMFMYATTVATAIKNGMKYSFPPHEYLLYFEGDFNVDANISNLETTDYIENGYHYNEIVLDNTKNWNLSGYYQSYKYWKGYEKEILSLFRFKDNVHQYIEQKYIDILRNPHLASIHIRRGDYLNHPNHHPALSLEYYNEAISMFNKEQVFLIFSDDPQYCKEHFSGSRFIVIEGNNQAQDMYLMTLCKSGNIIANSTMSWWGAYLSESSNVIAPKNWFGPAYSHFDTKDLLLEKWTKI